MTREIPGSGAVIEPIFNNEFGVRAVKVLDGGEGYTSTDPPRLVVTGCGIPSVEALLYPIIDDDSGKIVHVRVLDSGRGYDPLRLSITPKQDTPDVVTSFDINRVWQSNPNSSTTGNFLIQSGNLTDRLRILSDNDPKPADLPNERTADGGLTTDNAFDRTFIYRGGKDVPAPGARPDELNKATAIMANGAFLHTPDWGQAGGAPVGFSIDTVKNPFVRGLDEFDGYIDGNTYNYHSSRVIDHFARKNSVFENGLIRPFTWQIKVEFDNVMLTVNQVDETLGDIEVGRRIEVIGRTNSNGEIAKVVRTNGVVTRVYVRLTQNSFLEDDRILGANGFSFTVAEDPVVFSNGIFYINFGDDAAEFGNFIPNQYYFAPQNIQVPRNYLIIWDQSDASNRPTDIHTLGHPMNFSTTADGHLNGGELYYDTDELVPAPSADYENEFQPLFLMNSGETDRIYYYCKYHRYMSGYEGDEGYMTLSPVVDNDPLPNNYYIGEYYRGRITIGADDLSQYNPQLYRTVIVDGGTGTGSTGGFAIGRHVRFGNVSGGNRHVRLTLDLTDVSTLDLEVIRGNSFNGGEQPDGGEDLRIFFSGTVYGSSVVARYFDTSFTTLRSVTVSIPPDVRRANQVVYIYQANSSGFQFDHYGLKSITYGAGDSDYSRHPDGHSKILGMSFDGYPIYGPYGYNSSGSVVKMTPSYRLKVGDEIDGARPKITEAGTVTYTVTVSNGNLLIDGSDVTFLNLDRGKTYVFNQDDSSNDSEFIFISETENGWHNGSPPNIGNTAILYSTGVVYYLDGAAVSYETYIGQFNEATTREIRFTPRVDSPRLLYVFSYTTSNTGFRIVQDGYLNGDLVNDHIYDSTLGGDLDEYNGKFGVTPEYPNGTYAYFMTTDENDDPVYPYVIGKSFYGTPVFADTIVPLVPPASPSGASGKIILNDQGGIDYIQMKSSGDGYFGEATAQILGGEGSGATVTPVVQSITGLSLSNPGQNYATPPTLIFEGGGGQGARGRADIDKTGIVQSISVVDPGEFYQEPPYILITGGGGLGAKAIATVDQGQVTGITVTNPGRGYTSAPNIVFTKLVNLKRKVNARQSYNSNTFNVTGLLKPLTSSDTTIYVDNTDAFAGSGSLIINNEIVNYSAKDRERFTGVTRGTNFNYDQRVVLDTSQNDGNGISGYEFNVGDRVIRRVENANNKIAKVYDWNNSTRELFVTFEVDELAFIDGGIPTTEDAVVQFDAGLYNSSISGEIPHTVLVENGSNITLLTNPIAILENRVLEDLTGDIDADGNPIGDGIPDLINTGTDFENQISLDGGIYNSLYGIEETQGGQNTTLFQVGDSIKDASLPFKYASIIEAGGLSEGQPQPAVVTIYVDGNDTNGLNFTVNETITGDVSGVTASVVSWNPTDGILIVSDVTPYNTGNINIGVAGYLYKFSEKSTIVDFIIQDAGTNYSATPTLTIENIGDIQANVSVNMTAAGDQIESVNITNGGYGYEQSVDTSYVLHPTIDVVNDPGDTDGSGAVIQAVLGGERINGTGGAYYRIKKVEYQTQIRSE